MDDSSVMDSGILLERPESTELPLSLPTNKHTPLLFNLPSLPELLQDEPREKKRESLG